MKKLFKSLGSNTVDYLFLVLTVIFFVAWIIEGADFTGFLWIYIGYVVKVIIEKRVIKKDLDHKLVILDHTLRDNQIRSDIGLEPWESHEVSRPKTEVPMFTMIIRWIIAIATVAMLLYMFLDLAGIL